MRIEMLAMDGVKLILLESPLSIVLADRYEGAAYRGLGRSVATIDL